MAAAKVSRTHKKILICCEQLLHFVRAQAKSSKIPATRMRRHRRRKSVLYCRAKVFFRSFKEEQKYGSDKRSEHAYQLSDLHLKLYKAVLSDRNQTTALLPSSGK